MKNLLLLSSLFLIIINLTGCASFTKEVPVDTVKTVIITPPSNLLEPNVIPPPPDKPKYLKMDFIHKEDVLTNYIIALINVIKDANRKFLLINKNIDDQKKIINSK